MRTRFWLPGVLALAGLLVAPLYGQQPEQASVDVQERPAISQKLVGVYLVADAQTKVHEAIPLRIPTRPDATVEIDAEPILEPSHFERLAVEPVFPKAFTVGVSFNPAGRKRYAEMCESNVGRECVWVIDGVARTKSVVRYAAPGGGYGVDIDESKDQSEKLQAKLKAALAANGKPLERKPLTAAQWDGKAQEVAAASYLTFLLNQHQMEDGWIHGSALQHLHEQIVKRLAADPVDPDAGKLHACRREMERSSYVEPQTIADILDRVAAVDAALLTAAQGRESWLNTKFGAPPRERPKPPAAEAKPEASRECGAADEPPAKEAEEKLEIFGFEFGKTPAPKNLKDLPDLYEPAKDAPGKWAQRKDVFPAPLAEGIWLKYPVSRGKFFIEYRSDRQKPETERIFGPFEGDPFEILALEEKMRARLQTDYANDDYYRIRLMLRTGDKGLAVRAARLVAAASDGGGEIYQRESTLPQLREILKESAADFVRHGLAEQVAATEKKLAELERKIDELTVEIPDDKYLPGEAADSLLAKSVPKAAWSKPQSGLSFALVPTAQEAAIGSSVAIQIVVKNVSDKVIKFPTHDLTQEARATLKDAAGKEVHTRRTFFTGISPVQHYLLKPGEVLILVAPTLAFLPKGEIADGQFGVSTASVDPGKFQVQFQFTMGYGSAWSRGDDGVMRRTSPAKGEWKGIITTDAVDFTVTAAEKPK